MEHKPPTILIADDSPTVVDILTFLFSGEGYTVIAARDGIEAIKGFYKYLPDLVVLDIEMPKMDGYQVCRFLKLDPSGNSVPTIILTSHDAQSDRFRGLSVGADVYLVKNLEDGKLVLEARRLIQNSPWKSHPRPSPKETTEDEILHRLNLMLDRRLFISTVINEVQSISRGAASLDETTAGVLALFGRIFEFVVGGILLLPPEHPRLLLSVRHGHSLDLAVEFKVQLLRAAAEMGCETGTDLKTQINQFSSSISRSFPHQGVLVSQESWPLEIGGRVIGVVGMGSTDPIRFDHEGQDLLEHFLNHAAIQLEKAVLVQMVADANAALGRAFVDLKEAQAQLVQSEKLATIGQLTAGLVHEVNNPMNFIAGNLEHLEKYAGDLIRLAEKAEGDQDADLEFIKADLPDLLRDLREGVVRAQKIIGDLKAFSARDRGEGSQIDLKDLVEPALNLLRYQWGKEIRIIKHYEEMPAVECSAGQIGQIVMNLLVNAFEAIKESGREGVVEITVTSDGDWGLIRIRDNGKGISAEHLKNLFQPFFSTKDVGKGVGLGLSISQRIAHQHGGSIEVSSEPDAGACFTVRLPLSKSV